MKKIITVSALLLSAASFSVSAGNLFGGIGTDGHDPTAFIGYNYDTTIPLSARVGVTKVETIKVEHEKAALAHAIVPPEIALAAHREYTDVDAMVYADALVTFYALTFGKSMGVVYVIGGIQKPIHDSPLDTELRAGVGYTQGITSNVALFAEGVVSSDGGQNILGGLTIDF